MPTDLIALAEHEVEEFNGNDSASHSAPLKSGNESSDIEGKNDNESSDHERGTDSEANDNEDRDDEREDSGDEAWPIDQTRYASEPSNLTVVSQTPSRMASEFVMGAGFLHELPEHKEDLSKLLTRNHIQNVTVGSPTYISKMLVLTEAPHQIFLHGQLNGDGGGPILDGMEFMRDGVKFSTGILVNEAPQSLVLNKKSPFLTCIELQMCTWLEERTRVEKKISFIRLTSSQGTVAFGELKPSGFDGKKSIFHKPEKAEGRLLLVGVGFYDNKPIALQVVKLSEGCKDPVDEMDTTIYYNNRVISMRNLRAGLAEIEFKGNIALEDNEVWEILLFCMDAVENSSPSYGELMPNVINLLESALSHNLQAAHAVFRLDRFLTHVVTERISIRSLENDHLNFYSKLIPMKQMWGIFANTMERCKRITKSQPKMNSFSLCFFEHTWTNSLRAIIVFFTQLGLLALVTAHVVGLFSHDNSDEIGVAQCFIACVATLLLVTKVQGSIENLSNFCKIFPEYKSTAWFWVDMCSNGGFGVVILVLNFLLLLFTLDYLDLVLNATAVFFVLELDESFVDSSETTVTALYRSFLMGTMTHQLGAMDSRYWSPDVLRRKKGKLLKIHPATCSLVFLDSVN